MEKKQIFELAKLFHWSDLPEDIQEYFDINYTGIKNARYVDYHVLTTPDHERGNDHIPVSKWFVEHGAAKGEVILVYLGE